MDLLNFEPRQCFSRSKPRKLLGIARAEQTANLLLVYVGKPSLLHLLAENFVPRAARHVFLIEDVTTLAHLIVVVSFVPFLVNVGGEIED